MLNNIYKIIFIMNKITIMLQINITKYIKYLVILQIARKKIIKRTILYIKIVNLDKNNNQIKNRK